MQKFMTVQPLKINANFENAFEYIILILTESDALLSRLSFFHNWSVVGSIFSILYGLRGYFIMNLCFPLHLPAFDLRLKDFFSFT